MRTTTLAILIGALALGGCLNKADSAKMDAASARVLSLMTAKQYDVMYDEGSPDLKASLPKQGFVGFMQGIDAAYGACQPPAKAMSINVKSENGSYFATQGYTRQCEKGQAQLQVTMVMRGGVAQLAGIQTGSPSSSN